MTHANDRQTDNRTSRTARFLREWGAFLLAFAVFAIYQLRFSSDIDDLWFASVPLEGIGGWLVTRWQSWSSRLLIELCMIALLKLPMAVWRVLNLGSLCLLWYSATSLLLPRDASEGERRTTRWAVTVLLITYEAVKMQSAGWVATTINYVWPLAFALFYLAELRRALCGERIPAWKYAALVPALLFACSQELVACIMLGLSVCLSLYFLLTRRREWLSPLFLLGVALSVVSILNFLICPGNGVRFDQEVASWFPAYADYGLVHRVGLGLGVALNDLFHGFNVTLILFLTVLTVTAARRAQSVWSYLCAFFPSALFLCGAADELGFLLGISPRLLAFPTGTLGIHEGPLIFVYAFSVVCVLWNLYTIGGRGLSGLYMPMIFCAGFASRVVSGFSPAVFITGQRAALFYAAAAGCLSVMLLLDHGRRFYPEGVPRRRRVALIVPAILPSLAMLAVNLLTIR